MTLLGNGSYWIRVGPNPDIILMRREDTQKHTDNTDCQCKDCGRDWRVVATSQGAPRIASNQEKLEETRKDPPPEPSE